MKKKCKNYSKILLVGYLLVMMFFGYFRETSLQDMDTMSNAINVWMLLIAAVIYIHAAKRFTTVREIGNELRSAVDRIHSDYEEKKVMLWDSYKNEESVLAFKNLTLAKTYGAYKSEMKRLEKISENGFKCRIDDYVSKEMIDKVANRSLLNLVPGVMTGLGILGTFIGLSLGLQNFNTGSSVEISNSIAPLMSGIKVAFHTSIFGMILSLIFNYAYKLEISQAHDCVDEFIKHFKWYVCSDVENDYYSQVLVKVPARVGECVAAIMEPLFTRMSDTFEDFSENMLDNQVKGVGEIVDSFIEEMNRALGNNFNQLGDILEQTCELQKENITYMKTLLGEVGEMTHSIQEIHELSGKTVETMSAYIGDVEKLQTVINDSYMSVQLELEENRQQEEKVHKYIELLVEYEKGITETTKQYMDSMERQVGILESLQQSVLVSSENNISMLTKQTDLFIESMSDIVREHLQQVRESSQRNLDVLTEQASEYSSQMATVAKGQIQEIANLSNNTTNSMNEATKNLSDISKQFGEQLNISLEKTFTVFDAELEKITLRLSGTLEEVDSTTKRVPQVVAAAYEGMQKGLEDMRANVEMYVDNISRMQTKLEEQMKKINEEV